MWRSASLAVTAWVIAAGSSLALDDLKWLAPTADRVSALTQRPPECFQVPVEPEEADSAAMGRVAFNSPVLLGGLAARTGMSCASCHRNGHDNPDFFVQGASGEPGTVDVTTALFSKVRGDRIVNPVPIPSLLDLAGKDKLGTVSPTDSLPGFVHGVVQDEFQGRKPPRAIFEGLLLYLSSLETEACPDKMVEVVTLEADLAAITSTYAVLLGSLDRDDPDASDFLLLSLQAALGRIYQRFPDMPEGRASLAHLSSALTGSRPLIHDDLNAARQRLLAWRVRFSHVASELEQHQAASLYAPETLIRWLADR